MRLPSGRTYSFSNGVHEPSLAISAIARSSAALCSGGVTSGYCTTPEAICSRLWPIIASRVSLASVIVPSERQKPMPTMFDSTTARKRASLSRRASAPLRRSLASRKYTASPSGDG